MLQRTRANSRAPNVLMLVAEGLGYVPACGGLTRAAQQAMEVAQVECGFFLVGWSFFVLYMQTVERSQCDINADIFIRLRTFFFQRSESAELYCYLL